MAYKKQKKKQKVTKTFGQNAIDFILLFYLFIVLVFMPLFIFDHYHGMSFFKWNIYLLATVALIGTMLISGIIYVALVISKKTRFPQIQMNLTDILVSLYGISVLITLITCGHPNVAWNGADGWYMGALAQLLFVCTYLILSHLKVSASKVIWMSLGTSVICFIIGIAQRYGNDFLHLYYRMPAEVVRDYLSTIGNRTWYSAYISVLFPLGLYLFWQGNSKKQLWLAGIYSFLAFAAIVTNNSDSIYLSVAAVLFAIFVMSLGSVEKLCRWLYVLILWFSTCGAMSVLRIFYPDNVRELRGFSALFLNIKVVAIGLILTIGLLFVFRYFIKKQKKPTEASALQRKRLQKGFLISAAFVITLAIVIVALNTTGVFQKCFGFTINNSYLLFNDTWGDSRGFNWKLTLQMFWELPFVQKLFGVGSDCYSFFAYSNPAYAESLHNFFGTQMTVSNAHNEWLNALLCHGIIGSILYIGIFISLIVKCFHHSNSKNVNPFVVAVGLCALAYMSHNVFCYQQVCATGPIFILMGIASYHMKTQ